MKIKWHYPAYLDCDGNETEAEFANQTELLALPRIRDLMVLDYLFHHWELSRQGVDFDLLLLIDKNDRQWVIGEIPHDHGLDFPEWKPRETGITFRFMQNEYRDGTVVEIYMDGKFCATLTPGRDNRSVHLISTHLARGPVEDRGGDIPSYEFVFERG